MIRAMILYYVEQLGSLDTLESYLENIPQARRACGYGRHSPSRSTFTRFLQHLGSELLEELFQELVKLLFEKGMVTGRHLAIDSTHINAWSERKSKDKKHQDFKLAKNCQFARLGKTPKGFDICYRVHIATVTKSEIPIAIEIFPGNIHDRRAFEVIFERALQRFPEPLVISGDKGFSSGKNRQLVDDAQAMCIIRPTKTDLMGNSMEFFLPKELNEEKYWKLYTKRLAVERTFGRTKGYFRLGRPRVINEQPVRQHVFLSFICHQLMALVSANLGLKQVKYSLFS
ncbi:MAG: transposase [Candidatus Kariarchaeaceae archaeon]